MKFLFENMIPSDLDPIGVFLVSSGTRGDRLLFRYPFELPVATESLPECKKRTISGLCVFTVLISLRFARCYFPSAGTAK